MKKSIRIIIYSWILILSVDLSAKTIEFLAPEKVLIAEKIRYELKWDAEEIEDIQFPETKLYFLEDSPDIPWFEILYSEKKKTLLRWTSFFMLRGNIRFRFLGRIKTVKRNFPENDF